jgi:serine/threonine-protein kinase
MVGKTIGKYEILEEIGRGGMAIVYRGRDTELEREVAVKILHPHLSSQPESKRRFHREARAVARLRAPNILEIFDYSGHNSEDTYIVTEFIHGTTLRGFFESQREVPTEASALIAIEVCRGLRHAHENDIIHRDIKPENIMIRNDGVVKITDFGIAQMAGTTQMTMTGQILGSPAYMSPEHVENKPLDFRADIFSLGTLLYWMTTARLPFEGRNPHAVIKRIVEGDFVDPMRVMPAMGDRMAAIVRRCLEVNPDDRYGTVEALANDLEDFLRDLEIEPTPRELKTYLGDPDSYSEQLRPKLIEVLIRRGKEEKKARNLALALRYFNRVLSLDEANEEVLAFVEAMSSRNRLRWGLEIGAVVLTVLVIGAGITYGLLRSREGQGGADAEPVRVAVAQPSRDGGTAIPEEGGASDAEALPPTDDGDVVALASGGDEPGERPEVAPSVQPPSHPPANPTGNRLVRIVPDPPAARVFIDEQDFGEYGAAHVRGLEVTTGTHQVRLVPRDDFYEETVFSLHVPEAGADAGLLVHRRPLRLRPARVRVNTNAPSATVSIPYRERSRANRAFQVRLTSREERVEMIIDAEGYRSEVREVVLQAGQEYSLDVTLELEEEADGLATRVMP